MVQSVALIGGLAITTVALPLIILTTWSIAGFVTKDRSPSCSNELADLKQELVIPEPVAGQPVA